MKKQAASIGASLRQALSEGTCTAVCERYASLSPAAQTGDFGALDQDVVVLDTETTGFSLNHDELIQIAAARMRNGRIDEWFITFVNPGQPIPEEITHLTGITDEDVADAPTPVEALIGLVGFVGDSDIVAHNAEFDHSFVTKDPSGMPLLQNTWIDSLDLARIALPRLKSHRLIDLVRAFDAPISTHRADADVEALCTIYRILLAGVAAMPQPLVQEIATMAEDAEWPTIKVFKHFAADGAAEGPAAEAPASAPGTISPATAVAPAAAGTAEGPAATPAAAGAAEGPAAEAAASRASAAGARPGLNLRALRAQRIREVAREAKPDAGMLVADPHQELVFPAAETVAAAFGAEGVVGRLYEPYELRTEQVAMAEKVLQAFSRSINLAIEAGTGVGKSMAYLLPAALIARQNNIAIGIATKTNALLDQLIYKELPLIAEALGQAGPPTEAPASPSNAPAAETPAISGDAATATTIPPTTGDAAPATASPTTAVASAIPSRPLEFTALKGFTHYPCLRKVGRLVQDGARNRTVAGKQKPQAPSLAGLLSFIEQSEYDDIDLLKIDYRVLPRYTITTTSTDCLRRKCPFYGASCFVHGARRRAEAVDIVVTNHSLLFCDIAAEGGLLPPIRYWVVDEAHGIESEARSAFSLEVSAEEMLRLCKRITSQEASQNPFARALRTALAAPAASTAPAANTASTPLVEQIEAAQTAADAFAQAAGEFAQCIKTLAFFSPDKRNKGYEVVELWLNDEIRASETFSTLASLGRVLCDRTEQLVRASQEAVGALEGIDAAAEAQREIATVAMGLKDMLQAAETILFAAPAHYAYAATLSNKHDRVAEKLQALLVNVGERLNETLFANTHSVVFASATLTVADSFGPFEDALGLNDSESSQTATCQLSSSYDFDSQMTVYVADDIPEPNDPAYLPALQGLLAQAHLAQGGSMLTLFTNRKEMEKCFEALQPILKAEGLRLVCQKWGVSAKGLRDDFLADEHLSLFALKSFWEGFDAPGSTLKGVIIPKLPFSKPTDPLSCERALRDSQAWLHYVLPAAVLETKQATGRLIRSATDTGCVILADRRILTKGYGKTFLKSMPSRTIKICSTAAIARDLAIRSDEGVPVQ